MSALKFSQETSATLKAPATGKPQFEVEGQEALFKLPFKVALEDAILYFFFFTSLNSVAHLIIPNTLKGQSLLSATDSYVNTMPCSN